MPDGKSEIMAVVAKGGCMRPAVGNGQVVAAVRVSGRPLQVRSGDCVIFEADGRKFLHRVVRVAPQGLVTLDDTALTDESLVPLSAVLGICKVFPSGFIGLAWCRISRLLFIFGRGIKNALKRTSGKGDSVYQ
jgi:hypothetical protein